jgi:hypothetical protein
MRTSGLLLVTLLAVAGSLSCTSKEREARRLLIQASAYLQEGKSVELVTQLRMIIEEYPGTRGAETAQAMLAEAQVGYSAMAENMVRAALVSSQVFFIANPYKDLDMVGLTEGGFTGNPDVVVEVANGKRWALKITARHIAGDRVASIGMDGQVSWADYRDPGS